MFHDNAYTKMYNQYINEDSYVHIACMDKLSVLDQASINQFL